MTHLDQRFGYTAYALGILIMIGSLAYAGSTIRRQTE